MNRGRIALNVALVAAVGVGGTYAWSQAGDESVTASTNESIETVRRGDITSTVSASGNIASETATAVNFTVAGRVTEVSVNVGDRVEAGQVLAKVDDAILLSAVDKAAASLEAARTKAAKTKAGISDLERRQTEVQADQSQQSVRSAEVALANANASLTANTATYQMAVDQAAASLETAREALRVAEENVAPDAAAAQATVDTAEASLSTARSNADLDNTSAQKTVETATATLADSEQQLALSRSNLEVAQGSFDTKFASYAGDFPSLVARYTDDQTICKTAVPKDEVVCKEVGYLLSLAQAGQKNEATVTQNRTSLATAQSNLKSIKAKGDSSIASAQTSLTNAKNTKRTSANSGSQSVTNAKNSVVSAQNKLADAQNSQRVNSAKDKQSVATAQQSLASAQKAYQTQLATNAVKVAAPTGDQLASDNSTVAQAEDQLRQAKDNLAKAELKSPVAATVAAVNGSPGDNVTTGGAQEAFISLTDPRSLHVRVGFSEADALRIKLGQAATVSMDAASERVFTGTVTSVDETQTIVNNVVTYYADVSLVGDLEGLRPGMSASVDVIVDAREGALSLPPRAIRGNGKTAMVSVRTTSKDKDGKTVTADSPTRVTVGLRGDDAVEIVSGLSEGSQVVIASSSGLPGLGGGLRLPGGGGLGGGLP
jgi:HlyD family secretion protein